MESLLVGEPDWSRDQPFHDADRLVVAAFAVYDWASSSSPGRAQPRA